MKVSILLCVYNAERYIAQAIASTINQTFKDYELIIVDDGSSDETLAICRTFSDNRIIILKRRHGYISSLNAGLRKCQGEYVARMDADDIMEPERLGIQVKLMDSSPDITVCSSWARTFGEKEILVGNYVSGKVGNITHQFLTGNFIVHPSAMIRRSFLVNNRISYKNYAYAEDFKLWTDIARKGGSFYVIPQPLIRYRISKGQITHIHFREQEDTRVAIQQEIIEDELRHIPSIYEEAAKRLYEELLAAYQRGLLTADHVIKSMSYMFDNLLRNTQIDSK